MSSEFFVKDCYSNTQFEGIITSTKLVEIPARSGFLMLEYDGKITKSEKRQ